MRFRNLSILWCLVAGLVLLTLPVTLQADVFFKMKNTTSQFVVMGDTTPASETISIGWMGDKMARMDMDTISILLDSEQEIMYMINHQTKTYHQVGLGSLSDVLGSTGIDADDEQMQAMQEMMKSMMGQMKFTVTPTDESKKIGDYNCKKYQLDMSMMMMEMTSEIWASEEIDADMSKFYQLSYSMMASLPGFEKAIEEMKKIKGFSVYTKTTTKVMGSPMETTSELLEIDKKDAPKGTYDLPEGYEKVQPLNMPQQQPGEEE